MHETLRGKCVAKANSNFKSNLKCELNLNDKDMFVLVTEDGLECKTDVEYKWNGIRATIEVTSGKYMYEVLIVDGLCTRCFSFIWCDHVNDLHLKNYSFRFV